VHVWDNGSKHAGLRQLLLLEQACRTAIWSTHAPTYLNTPTSFLKAFNWASVGLVTFSFFTATGPAVQQYICEQIWKKGPLHTEAEFLFLITHNFKAVIATGLKPGTAILQSLHYTCCKFRALSASDLGAAIASVTCSGKSVLLCLPLEPYCFR